MIFYKSKLWKSAAEAARELNEPYKSVWKKTRNQDVESLFKRHREDNLIHIRVNLLKTSKWSKHIGLNDYKNVNRLHKELRA